MNACTMSADETLKSLKVHKDQGLNTQEIEISRKIHGENVFYREKAISLPHRLLAAASEPMIIMLIAASAITLAVNLIRLFTGGQTDFLECIGIFVAIALSVVITVVMEGRSAKAFEALSKMNQDVQVKVIRRGAVCLIPQKEVVVGDILCVESGDKLPADGRLVESTAIQADESALTGESMPVNKNAAITLDTENVAVAERVNMLYSGSYITSGSGCMVVTAVGNVTEFGKIAHNLSSTERSITPLQEKMVKLGKRITLLGATAAAIVFLIQVIIFIANQTASIDAISEAFITSIVLIVAAVPEGLPTIVAVSLSINIIKMSKQNALVKKMIACETVGCINVICSDKTGTLTENRMTVSDIYDRTEIVKPDALKNHWLLQNFCVNSTADINTTADQTFIGNPTECALLIAAEKAGWAYKTCRQRAIITHVFPFCSEEKHMTTVVAQDNGYIVFVKGSPEQILSMCALNKSERDPVEQAIIKFQEKSSRIIAFAHKTLPSSSNPGEEHEEIEKDMTFDGFVAITDPLRSDVFASVERCREAGISLKILTGDNIVTATAIAKELHLLDGNNRAIEASAVECMSDRELAEALPSIRVIARSTPAVKMRVVNALKSTGNVVAVTGDGINDAPALKNADVGIAMGISGTEVSKEASDIILLDDSFSTIVKAVQWGRGIYENFQRFIQFQLTVNLSSVVVVLASILTGFVSPFSALQLLWINIVMDGPPALTLGLEPIRGNLMDRKPTKRNASIVSKNMLLNIMVNGIFISLLFLAQQRFNFLGGTPGQMSTILFTLFVLFQLFNAFNSRELSNNSIFKSLAANKLMLLIFFITFCLQVLFTQYGGAFFGTVPLSLSIWLKMLGTAFTVILFSELFKLFRRILSNRPNRI